jgi:hypothetical protein
MKLDQWRKFLNQEVSICWQLISKRRKTVEEYFGGNRYTPPPSRDLSLKHRLTPPRLKLFSTGG